VGLFDWFGKKRQKTPRAPIVWSVRREGAEVVVEDGRGGVFRADAWGARSVRVVPNARGGTHGAPAGGWQVALFHDAGDAPLGPLLPDWPPARDLAEKVCEATELPLHELTERMFSQVGRFTTQQDS
jgi:hypothetical protein